MKLVKPTLKIFTSVLAGAAILALVVMPARQGSLDTTLFQSIAAKDDGLAVDVIACGANVQARYLSPRRHPSPYDIVLGLIGRPRYSCGNTWADPLQEMDTPLVAAARGGRTIVVRELLNRGSAVNPDMRGGLSPLMWTVIWARTDTEREHAATARLLIDKGAAVNARTAEGETALSYANRGNHKALIRILKEAGGHE
jgi:hypothetical protein